MPQVQPHPQGDSVRSFSTTRKAYVVLHRPAPRLQSFEALSSLNLGCNYFTDTKTQVPTSACPPCSLTSGLPMMSFSQTCSPSPTPGTSQAEGHHSPPPRDSREVPATYRPHPVGAWTLPTAVLVTAGQNHKGAQLTVIPVTGPPWQCGRGEVSLVKSFGRFVEEPPCCRAEGGRDLLFWWGE